MNSYLDMMNQWFILKQESKGIERYLKAKGYQSIAIYGMGIYGRHVVRELQKSDIKIVYGIDRKKMNPYQNVSILQPVDELPYADVIINTVIHEHISIKNALKQITSIPVVNLEDVVFGSYE